MRRLRWDLKKEKERSHMALGELNKIYLERNKLENIFIDCVEETRKIIFNRKLKDCQKIFTKCDNVGNILEEEISPDSDLEELFSYMLGNIADQIAQGYREDIKESKE